MISLLEVYRSGYYVRLDRQPPDRMTRPEDIEQKVALFHDDSDAYPFDAVKREEDTNALNQVWIGEITYLRPEEGWVCRTGARKHPSCQSPTIFAR
jgi:hypothetical protein